MFFVPYFAAGFLEIAITSQTISVLRGMGGLIIGSGNNKYFLRNQNNTDIIKDLLLTTIIIRLLGYPLIFVAL